MMDLLSREDVMGMLDDCFLVEVVGGKIVAEKEIRDKMLAIPTIDAVPVVRCKDCKHWGMGIAGETDRIKCCMYAHYMVGENGYCVYGEKGGAE